MLSKRPLDAGRHLSLTSLQQRLVRTAHQTARNYGLPSAEGSDPAVSADMLRNIAPLPTLAG